MYPRATAGNGQLQTEADWKVEKTFVKKGASIGSGCTILANVTIGENAIVGAGSVVTRDIPPNSIAFGNPAKVRRHIDANIPQTKIPQAKIDQTKLHQTNINQTREVTK